jgi:uncharacterized membrane protein YfcA
MSPLQAVAVLAAGVAAGTVNTIVGSGSLITFPTLLAVGYSPLVANVSNTVGLMPGAVSGSIGYRRELAGQRARAVPLGVVVMLGGLSGGLLLLAMPASSFERVVPYLILVACGLIAAQPRLTRAMEARRGDGQTHPAPLYLLMYLAAVYGGYFGAAQSVIAIALLGIFVPDHLQRLNALKNVLAALMNAAVTVLFLVAAPIAWLPTLLLASGAIAGGQIGAHIGRRLSPLVLRTFIIVVGTGVAVKLLIG